MEPKTKKIVFIFGGPSAEHEVSVNTAKSVLPAFESHYALQPVFITKENMWVVGEYSSPKEAWAEAERLMKRNGVNSEIALDDIEKEDIELVFLGLHGEFGEDGTVQALLEARGLPFTGSDSEASALAMDKPRVFELLQNEAIQTPDFLEVNHNTHPHDINDFCKFEGFPVVVMPADRGSSVGVHLVKHELELHKAIEDVRKITDRVMITKFIEGTEFSCGVLVTSATELTPLPPTEIQLNAGHQFWDYESKYVPKECEEITPAKRPQELLERIQGLAMRVHQLVGADGYSRTDMILGKDNHLYILEINTLPGMTAMSVLPAQAKALGLTFSQLLTTICNNIDRSGQDYITAT